MSLGSLPLDCLSIGFSSGARFVLFFVDHAQVVFCFRHSWLKGKRAQKRSFRGRVVALHHAGAAPGHTRLPRFRGLAQHCSSTNE